MTQDQCTATTEQGKPCTIPADNTGHCHVHRAYPRPNDVNTEHRGTPGIYLIDVGELFYIGSSKDLYTRTRNHRSRLNRGTHPNYRLQREYTRTQTYAFTILEYCDQNQLLPLEQQYLDQWIRKPRCANIQPQATCGNQRPRQETRPELARARPAV